MPVMDADVIVIGGGLSGLVATTELAAAGRSVIVVDCEPLQSLGGQAYWSLGGLFLVDTPEQRRLRIHDSVELALADWMGSAAFDRDEDYWPRRWAEAFVRLRRRRGAAAGCAARGALVPAGAVGRARRLRRAGARQLGAALPPHLGHRSGPGRAVRRARC